MPSDQSAYAKMVYIDKFDRTIYGERYSFDHYTMNIKKSTDTALEEAEQLLDDLGIEGYSYEGMVKKYGTTDDGVIYKHQAHGVIFTKTYNGVNRLVAPDGDSIVGYTITESGGAEYAVHIQNDMVLVRMLRIACLDQLDNPDAVGLLSTTSPCCICVRLYRNGDFTYSISSGGENIVHSSDVWGKGDASLQQRH